MTFIKKHCAGHSNTTVAALILSALAVWRMPDIFGLPKDSPILVGSGLSFALVAAFYLLFRFAFPCDDRRLKCASYGVGFIFSVFSVVGKKLDVSGAFDAFSWGGLLDGLFLLFLFTIVYGAALLLVFQRMRFGLSPMAAQKPESVVSRIAGNGFVLVPLFMICWLPVWLAFWPGNFGPDSVTQFYTYLDWMHSAHHPLLHTLFLGWCFFLGIDNSPEGSAAIGLSVYSVAQMLLMAVIFAYACHWLRRKSVPLSLRLLITAFFALFPFCSLWSFNAQKDILFGGLTLLLVLELIDLWQADYALLRSPLRIAKFVLVATFMMLLRNNGIYAFLLLIPFAVLWAKGSRLRVGALLLACVASYFLANSALMWITEAERSETVEVLSIPLQQIGRTLRDYPESIEEDEDGILEYLYGDMEFVTYYSPILSDPLKWALDDELLDESLPELASLWAKMGVRYPKPYTEAFLVQNLPYFLPGAAKYYDFDLRIVQIDLYPIEEHSFFPSLRALYETYNKDLTFLGLPWIRPLSDTAVYVWLCIAGIGLAWYRREKQWLAGLSLLLAIWGTCLLGPGAIIRYMLSFFYTIPVVLAAMLAPVKKEEATSCEQTS